MSKEFDNFSIVQKANEDCLDRLKEFFAEKFPELGLKFSGAANGASIRLTLLITKAGQSIDELKAVMADYETNISYPEIHLTISQLES